MRTLKRNLMYSLCFMLSHMCNLLYDFLVLFIALVFLLWLVAWQVGSIHTPVNFDSPLLVQVPSQKLHNNLYNVNNNHNNVLKFIYKAYGPIGGRWPGHW